MRGLGQPNSMPDLQTNDSVVDLSSRIDSAINSEAANNLNQQQSHEREVLDGECASVKDQVLCRTKEQTTELAAEIPENSVDSSEYFDVKDALGDIKEKFTLNGIDLDIDQCIDGFCDYIEKDLHSSDPIIKEKIILSISIRIQNLSKQIDKIIEKAKKKIRKKGGDENDLSGQRWIIAGKIQDLLKEVTNKILPSAFLVQEYDNTEDPIAFVEDVVNSFDYKEYMIKPTKSTLSMLRTTAKDFDYKEYMAKVTDEDPNPSILLTVEMQKDIASMQFRRNISESREMLGKDIHPKSAKFHEFGWNYAVQQHTLQIDREIHEQRFQAIGGDASSLREISLLNEEDKKIEKKAMLCLMGGIAGHIAIEGGPALLASVVPGAGTVAGAFVGAALGGAIDFRDAISGEDAILTLLKKAGIVEEEFHMDKAIIDNILAGVGLIPGVTLAVKSATLATLMNKFGILGPELIDSMEMVLPLLKGSKNTETKSVVKGGTEAEKSTAYRKQEVAYKMENGERVTTGVAPQHIQDANGVLEDGPRLAKAEELLGITLNDKQKEILLRAHYLPEGDNAERGRILAQKINFEGEGLEKRAFDINQSRIVMNENITGGPGGKLDEIESAKLLEMAYGDGSMLKKLQEFPAIGKLLASFGEQGSDIGKALSNVHIDDALMQNFSVISGDLILVFTEAEISRINTFLGSHGKKLPEGIDIEDLKEVGDTNLDGETLTLLINTLRDIKLNKTDGIEAVAAKSNDIAETISVTKKLEGFDKIEVTHPEIFSVYQAIQEGENFGGLLTKIDFKAEGVLDALDYMVDNCRGFITESQLLSIAQFTKKSPDELRANLEFTDGEAGVTIEFMRNIFRVQQEVTTKRKIIDNPFEMEMTDLARLIKRIFLDKGPEISQYIQNTPELLESIKVLKKANFGDPEFIVNHIPRLSDFYDVFGKEALVKVISDVFKLEDIELNKVIGAIENYDGALIFANKAQANKDKAEFINLNETLLSVGIPLDKITSSMRDTLVILQKSLESGLIDKDFESIAYLVGRNEGMSYLAKKMGNDNFIKLLNTLNVKIPDENTDTFFQIIQDISKGI